MPTVDAGVLEAKVKEMYRLVVEQPHGVYHFAMASVWSTWAAALGWMPATPRSWSDQEDGVVGIDFTPQQVARARRLAAAAGLDEVEFHEGRIESIPASDSSVDCVISNGVVNLSADKAGVFAEAPGCCDRVADWRSPTSSASGS